MATIRQPITPIDILRNCRGKAVSVELFSGQTVNGVVIRADRAMNVVLKQCVRTAEDGETFWRSRECLVRGSAVRSVRLDEAALKAYVVRPRAGAQGQRPKRGSAAAPSDAKSAPKKRKRE